MKFKKIIVPQYTFKDDLGEYKFSNIEVLVPIDSNVTEHNFNQYTSEHFVSSNQIQMMGQQAARRYFNQNYTSFIEKEKKMSAQELNGIKLLLGINATDLANLLGINKSNTSRMLSGELPIKPEHAILLMERLSNELDSPGVTAALVAKLKDKSMDEKPMSELNISANLIAEWIIREAIKLEDFITNLKLQKLLYYAQGIAIGRYNVRLFAADLYAWEHGPVVKEVYHSYKGYGSNPLVLDPSADITLIESNGLVLKILKDMMATYGNCGASILRNKSHNESPWLETKIKDKIEFAKIQDFFQNYSI